MCVYACAQYKICDCLVSSAVRVVGRQGRRQPDWFVESEHLLSLLLDAKRAA